MLFSSHSVLSSRKGLSWNVYSLRQRENTQRKKTEDMEAASSRSQEPSEENMHNRIFFKAILGCLCVENFLHISFMYIHISCTFVNIPIEQPYIYMHNRKHDKTSFQYVYWVMLLRYGMAVVLVRMRFVKKYVPSSLIHLTSYFPFSFFWACLFESLAHWKPILTFL